MVARSRTLTAASSVALAVLLGCNSSQRDLANDLGPASDQALRAEIDAFLRERVGVQLTSARSVTVFFAA